MFEHGQFIDQWTIKFIDPKTKMAGTIRVRWSALFDEFIEFEVSLAEVPIADYQGRDVIVNWHMFDDFDTNSTFWTDSNGLEMQERHIDQTNGFKRNMGVNKIGRNYYPVDSAIAMRDTKKNMQVTVMNDRAQGGSADLAKASIELMQQRRLTQDDNQMVFEILNETDTSGNGFKSNALYYMQIFDMATGQSKQREQQIRIDQPLQYFFTFGYSETEAQPKPYSSNYGSTISGDGVTGSVACHAFPLEKNKVLVRFTNLADKFDSKTAGGKASVNVEQWAVEFYNDANPQQAPIKAGDLNFSIEETTLSGNQPMAQMLEKKAKFAGVGDGAASASAPGADGPNSYSLDHQRIRSFLINFVPTEAGLSAVDKR